MGLLWGWTLDKPLPMVERGGTPQDPRSHQDAKPNELLSRYMPIGLWMSVLSIVPEKPQKIQLCV